MSELRGPSRSPVLCAGPAADLCTPGIPGVLVAGSTNSQWLRHSRNSSSGAGGLRGQLDPAARVHCEGGQGPGQARGHEDVTSHAAQELKAGTWGAGITPVRFRVP